MNKETFANIVKKVFPVAKDMPDNGRCAYISCLYEPSINPNYIEIMESVPEKYKNNCFFTTNIVKHLSDDEIERLAHCNIHHINISVETFNVTLYEKITNVKNTCFYDNLERIAGIFHKTDNHPKLYFITMIMQDNYNELVEIAKQAHEIYGPDIHEFRTPYIVFDKEFEKILLSSKQLEIIEKGLAALDYNNLVTWTGTTLEQYNQLKLQREGR